jgi:DNA invertase Pin-like site-specific DNA recombinase
MIFKNIKLFWGARGIGVRRLDLVFLRVDNIAQAARARPVALCFRCFGVFAEFERAMIRERVMAGLARARADGKQLGRRTVEQSHAKKVKAALALRSKGLGIRRIAREVGLGVGTVVRLIGAEAEARPA